ncbi:MAG: hypothetical protein ACRDQ0_07770 [Pseudonocardia sp.]
MVYRTSAVNIRWTGPELEPSYYDAVRGGFEEWLDRLEKSGVTG